MYNKDLQWLTLSRHPFFRPYFLSSKQVVGTLQSVHQGYQTSQTADLNSLALLWYQIKHCGTPRSLIQNVYPSIRKGLRFKVESGRQPCTAQVLSQTSHHSNAGCTRQGRLDIMLAQSDGKKPYWNKLMSLRGHFPSSGSLQKHLPPNETISFQVCK